MTKPRALDIELMSSSDEDNDSDLGIITHFYKNGKENSHIQNEMLRNNQYKHNEQDEYVKLLKKQVKQEVGVGSKLIGHEVFMSQIHPLVAESSEQFLKKAATILQNSSLLHELHERVIQSVKVSINIIQQKAKAMVQNLEMKMNQACKLF